MTREEIRNDILKIPNKHILCELATGVGKSLVAIEWLQERNIKDPILIVIPRLVLINNWKAEFKKWGYEEVLQNVTFSTYISFPKVVYTKQWGAIIYDEGHHLSDRCRAELPNTCNIPSIILSATVNRNIKMELKSIFKDLSIYKISTRDAIDNNILPDPEVYLIPLQLDNIEKKCQIVKNKNQKIALNVPYSQRFKFMSIKNRRIVVDCTQQQYYNDISSLIEFYKKRSYDARRKQQWLRACGERLKWLSDQKTAFVKKLLSNLKNQRTLTFCNSIDQTEELGKYCINSKNKASTENLEKFNAGRIKHITACNILDEGVNLTNCRIGVYATLNSSERMITQKLGRLLRHPNPILIIPYFKNTRDEEIVNKMIENYNPELIHTITNLNQLTL